MSRHIFPFIKAVTASQTVMVHPQNDVRSSCFIVFCRDITLLSLTHTGQRCLNTTETTLKNNGEYVM